MTTDNGLCDFCGIAFSAWRQKRVLDADDPTVWCLNCPAGAVFVFRYASDAELSQGVQARRAWIDANGGVEALKNESDPRFGHALSAHQYLNAAKMELSRRERRNLGAAEAPW